MKNFLFILCFSIPGIIIAQDRIPAELTNGQFSLNILQPSVSYEHKLAEKQTLHFIGGLTVLMQEDIFDDVKGGLTPYVQAEFRNYYPRKKVKKELNPNSGNFVGLVAGYNFAPIADNFDTGNFDAEQAFYMGPVWGIQRNYKSGIHLGLSLGFGFITGKNTDFDFHGIGGFQLGFVIGR